LAEDQRLHWHRIDADEVWHYYPGRVTFTGSVADTPWDPGLARAMRARGRAVFEEDVTDDLLGRALRCHTPSVG